MQLNEHTAIVDNDFINHLVECHLSDQKLIEDLKVMFSELELSAVMHPLVYDNELLHDRPRVTLLFEQKAILKAEFEDIFQNEDTRKNYYIQTVKFLYHTLMGEDLPVKGCDVLTYWVRRHSLGEVHSFATCLLCECVMFLSDDRDSKRLKQNLERVLTSKVNVNVYNRQDFMEKFMAESETKLPRKDRQSLTYSSST